ncbi:MAG TPA: hypothetical protein PK977_00050, partial [Chitinophagaceae bacterium]|nr:hypothetical protein [Chitinophagaceae bacterium]
MHLRRILIFIIVSNIPLIIHAQSPKELGAEYIRSIGKVYNTTKVAARGERFDARNSYSAGITYQLASGKSYSVSRGFGVYFGYRYAFGKN